MSFKSIVIFAATAFTLLFVSCAESNFSSGAKLRAGDAVKKGLRLEVAPSGKTINIGQMQSFTATLITDDSEKKDVTKAAKWQINAPKLAIIDSKGTVKAKEAGPLIVTATYEDVVGSATLTIVDGTLKEIRVTPATESILIGGTVPYKALGIFADGFEEDITEKATWKASDIQVAFLQNNIATGITSGISTITASFANKEGSASLEVKQVIPEKLEIAPLNASLPVSIKEPYSAVVTYSDGSTKDVTRETQWTIVDSVVAKFATIDAEKHILEALKPGSSIVEAKYLDLTASTPVTVNEATVVSVAVTPLLATVKIGATQAYLAKATFSDGQTIDITTDAVWTSSDTPIATISNVPVTSGLATAVSKGVAKIMAVYRSVPSNEATLTVPQPDIVNFPLTVSKSGTGTGVVSSNPSGIDCGNNCTKQFPENTQVTLTPVPSADSEFTSWGGACAGSGACVVTLSAAKTVSAVFTLKKFTLTASKSGNGVIKASGIDCGNDCSESYNINENIAVTATPGADSEFTGWGGACSGKAACTVAMSANKTVSATFTVKKFDLTVTKSGNGTVSGSGINCGTECKKSFDSGTIVTLTATPAADSTFTGWTGACTGTTCTITMNEAKNATATFALKKFTLSVTKNGNGSVAASGINCGSDCSESYNIGTNVTLTATPDADSTFVGWGGACSGTSTCSVTISEAKSVIATFALKRFTLSVTKTGVGTVTGSGINCGSTCSETYNINSAVSLTATPDANYRFSNWTGACSGSAACNISMTEAKSVAAVFVIKTFTLTAAVSGNGKIDASGIDCGTDCSEAYNINTNVALTATPNADSTFTGWSGACTGSGACSVAMTASKSVTANFALKRFRLDVATTGDGSGSVTGTGISCGTDCDETYNVNTNVTLSASALSGSVFSGWSGSCTGTGSCTISMSQARNVTANFKINCDVNAVENVAATFNTPLAIAYKTGDMNRRTMDDFPNDKHRLQRIVNQQCIDNFDPTVDSQQWTNPVISADVDTRNAICQLYGYQKATASFGYYQLASPTNDHNATWLTATKRMFVNKDASRAPSYNKILVWTGCTGKLYNSCTNTFKSDFRCKN